MRLKNENWKKAYNKLAEDYFDLQHKYDTLNADVDTLYAQLEQDELDKRVKSGPWSGCACGNSSTCGTTFTTEKVDKVNYVVNSKGVVDKSNLTEGRYTVLVKRED